MAKDRLGKDSTFTRLQLQTRYHIWSNLTFKNLVRPLYAFFLFFLFFFFSSLLLLLLLIPFYRWSDEEIAVSGRLTHLESTMLTFNQVSDSKPVLSLLCHREWENANSWRRDRKKCTRNMAPEEEMITLGGTHGYWFPLEGLDFGIFNL